jgi:GNAT superfamily N-acetyltransferase
MDFKNEKSRIIIRTGNNEDIIELQMCANEFIEFIDDFEINLHNEKYFILAAYYCKNLSGILLAENFISKVNGLETLIPKIQLIFLFVNSTYRNKGIASLLLKNFIKIQKKEKIGSIYINLPQKYKFGKKFLEKFNFVQIKVVNNKIVLERKLWYDFGIESCDFSKHRKQINLNNNTI